MKTTALASTLLLGFTVAFTSLPANATITIDAIDVTEFSTDVPEQTQTTPLHHSVKGHKKGGNRGGHSRGGRDRNNLASDGNIGNGTLRARIQHEQRYSNHGVRKGNGSLGPFKFLQRIFGN